MTDIKEAKSFFKEKSNPWDAEDDFIKTFIGTDHPQVKKSPHRKLYMTLRKHFRNTDDAGKKPHIAKLAKHLTASLRQHNKPVPGKGGPSYIPTMHKQAFSHLKKELSQSQLAKIRHDASVKAWKTRKAHGEAMSDTKKAKAFFKEELSPSQLDKIRHEAAIKAWKTRRLHGFRFTMRDHDDKKIRDLIKMNAPHAKISVAAPKGKLSGPSPSHTYKVDFGDKGISHDTAKLLHKAAFNSHLGVHKGRHVIFSKVVHSDDREHGAGKKKTSKYYAPSIPVHDEHGVMDPKYKKSLKKDVYSQAIKNAHPHGTGLVGQEGLKEAKGFFK